MSRFSVKPDYYTVAPVSDDAIVTGGLILTKKLDIYFIDINSNYRMDQKGLIIYDEDVIKNQIANILATPLGSDHFEPTYGSNLPYRIHDPVTNSTAFLLYNDTIDAISKWMRSKITVLPAQSFVRPIDNDPDNDGYEIRLIYYINNTKAIASYDGFILR